MIVRLSYQYHTPSNTKSIPKRARGEGLAPPPKKGTRYTRTSTGYKLGTLGINVASSAERTGWREDKI